MKKLFLAALLSMVLFGCVFSHACAEEVSVLRLPDGLKEVEAEAFYRVEAVREIVLPEGVENVGARAFADSGIKVVHLPESLVFIEKDS